MADWFRGNPRAPFSMHAPLYADEEMGRERRPQRSTWCIRRRSRRIDAMDEMKRALEVAEKIPFTTWFCIWANATIPGARARWNIR